MIRPDDIDPNHCRDRPLQAAGHMQVDFEERAFHDHRRRHSTLGCVCALRFEEDSRPDPGLRLGGAASQAVHAAAVSGPLPPRPSAVARRAGRRLQAVSHRLTMQPRPSLSVSPDHPKENSMRNARRIARAVLIALLPALFSVSALAQGADKPAKPAQTLSATPDGKYIVDATGQKKLQYLDSAKAFVPMTVEKQPDGKLRSATEKMGSDVTIYPCNCRNECMRWDANGNCNGTYRTCDICTK